MSKGRKILTLVLVMLMILVVSSAFGAVNVVNGSFESPTITTGTSFDKYGYCLTTSSIAGWTGSPVNGASSGYGFGLNGGAYSAFANNGAVPNGKQVAFMQRVATLSQSIDGFEAGTTYLLSYRENARYPKASPYISVLLDSDTIVPSHAITSAGKTGNWTTCFYAYNGAIFTTTSGIHTLTFSSDYLGADNSALLDDVRIMPVSDAGEVTGKVFNEFTGAALSGVAVSLDNGGITTTTDENGTYILYTIPGNHTVVVSSDNTAGKSISFTMPDPVSTVNIDLPVVDLSTPTAKVVDTFARDAGTDLGSTESTDGAIQIPWTLAADTTNAQLTGSSLELMNSTTNPAVYLGQYNGANFAPENIDLSVSFQWNLNCITGKSEVIAYREPTLDYAGGGYYVLYNSTTKTVSLMRGTTTVASKVLTDAIDTYDYTHTFRIRAIGTHHQVWLTVNDGSGATAKLIDTYDSNNISGGYVGLGCDSANDVYVSDFSLNTYTVPSWTFNGTVKDVDGNAIPGAYVTVAGTTATTGEDGSYSATIPETANFYVGEDLSNIPIKVNADGYKTITPSLEGTITSSTLTQDYTLSKLVAKSITDIKLLPDGTGDVYLKNVVVTGQYNGYNYVEAKDRSCGIKIKPASLNLYDAVDIEGTVNTENGERYITPVSTYTVGTSEIIGPFGVSNKTFAKGSGLSIVGLLVKSWGKVTYADPNCQYVYIDDGSGVDDGSGNTGVKVVLTDAGLNICNPPVVGGCATITGVAGYDSSGSGIPVIYARSLSDLAFAERPANFTIEASIRVNNTNTNVQSLICMRQRQPNTPKTGYFFALLPHWSSLANNAPGYLLMLYDGDASHTSYVASGNLPDGIDWSVFHTVKITAIGNSWSATLDDNTLFEDVADNSGYALVRGGFIGLGTIGSNVDFDYIKISDPNASEPTIFDTFTDRTILGTTEDSGHYPWIGDSYTTVGNGLLNSTYSSISAASIK